MLRRATDYSFLISFLPSKQSTFVSSYVLPSYLPYISSINLLDETITLYNPSSYDHSMNGYYLHDYHQKHCFKFPSQYNLPAKSFVTIYCCPGKLPHHNEMQDTDSVLLWRNNDGSLRKKEVLNNDGDTVELVNGDNVKVAVCSRTLNEISMTEIISKNHPMHIFLLKVIAFCCYLRLFSLVVLVFATSMQWHGMLIDSFVFSMVVDFISRMFCYWLYGSADQLDFLSSSLSSLGDRLSYFAIALSCLLSLFTSSERSIPLPIAITTITTLFAPSVHSIDASSLIVGLSGTMILEIASSWMYLTAETATFKRRATSNKIYPEDDAIDFLRFYLPSLYSLSTILAELAPLIFYCRFHSTEQLNLLSISYFHLTSALQLLHPSLHNFFTALVLVGETVLLAAFGFKQMLMIIQLISSTSRLSLEVISQRTKENIFASD